MLTSRKSRKPRNMRKRGGTTRIIILRGRKKDRQRGCSEGGEEILGLLHRKDLSKHLEEGEENFPATASSLLNLVMMCYISKDFKTSSSFFFFFFRVATRLPRQILDSRLSRTWCYNFNSPPNPSKVLSNII